MLIDRDPAEDVFARVPELAAPTAPGLVQRADDQRADDQRDGPVRVDLSCR